MSVAESAVPLFLKHIAHDVFVCGKSINLIRIIDPQVSYSFNKAKPNRLLLKVNDDFVYLSQMLV